MYCVVALFVLMNVMRNVCFVSSENQGYNEKSPFA